LTTCVSRKDMLRDVLPLVADGIALKLREITSALLDVNETRQLKEAIELMLEFEIRLLPSS
jgi:hypothetical protein